MSNVKKHNNYNTLITKTYLNGEKMMSIIPKIPRIEQPDGLVYSYDHDEKIMTSSFPTNYNEKNFEIIEDQIDLQNSINEIKKIKIGNTLNYVKSNEGWKIPTIEKLKTVLGICGFLGINRQFGAPVLSSTADPKNNSCVLALDFNTGKIVSLDPSKCINFEVVHIVIEK